MRFFAVILVAHPGVVGYAKQLKEREKEIARRNEIAADRGLEMEILQEVLVSFSSISEQIWTTVARRIAARVSSLL